ncbi:TetR/AcrR family transcriptional regulator [Nocardia sp. NPDC059691]|uniref:TetR/AcrR family transcriptional regulator n=1 Tax=unclassified Nocardia TaxID=2637762 RepID=UPI0036C30A7C
MADRLPHTLRSDARDNRERILDAARALFAAEGMTVPMRDIARHARVGPATLYRHFPTKEILATAAFAGEMRACRALVEQGLSDPDPWHGFCRFIENICALHADNRSFTEAFTSTFPDAFDFAAERAAALRAVGELARRAEKTGQLRPDFAVADLSLMLMAHRGIRAGSQTRVAASRRFAALMIQAFRASPENGPLSAMPRAR